MTQEGTGTNAQTTETKATGKAATAKAAAKKAPAKKVKAANKKATAKVVDPIIGRIDALEKQVAAHTGSIDEMAAKYAKIETAVSRLPAHMQDLIETRIEKLRKELPVAVRKQVLDMADTVLLDGVKKSIKATFTKILNIGKKVGGVFVRETTAAVKEERERHKAAREGAKDQEASTGKREWFFSRINPFGRKAEPEAAAAN